MLILSIEQWIDVGGKSRCRFWFHRWDKPPNGSSHTLNASESRWTFEIRWTPTGPSFILRGFWLLSRHTEGDQTKMSALDKIRFISQNMKPQTWEAHSVCLQLVRFDLPCFLIRIDVRLIEWSFEFSFHAEVYSPFVWRTFLSDDIVLETGHDS